MNQTLDTSAWFIQRNFLVKKRGELPREVLIYLMVTLATRPETIPEDVRVFLASRCFCLSKDAWVN